MQFSFLRMFSQRTQNSGDFQRFRMLLSTLHNLLCSVCIIKSAFCSKSGKVWKKNLGPLKLEWWRQRHYFLLSIEKLIKLIADYWTLKFLIWCVKSILGTLFL